LLGLFVYLRFTNRPFWVLNFIVGVRFFVCSVRIFTIYEQGLFQGLSDNCGISTFDICSYIYDLRTATFLEDDFIVGFSTLIYLFVYLRFTNSPFLGSRFYSWDQVLCNICSYIYDLRTTPFLGLSFIVGIRFFDSSVRIFTIYEQGLFGVLDFIVGIRFFDSSVRIFTIYEQAFLGSEFYSWDQVL
jgi:hypothetical protein